MTYTDLMQKERNVLDYMRGMKDIPAIEHQLKNVHREGTMSGVAIAYGMVSKKVLYTQEMGIGKTFVAMGLIENILRANSDKKVMFCGTNDKMNEYLEVFNENLTEGWGITSTTAGEENVRRAFRDLDNGCRILISSHSVWDKGHRFHEEFIPRLNEFQAFILDEGGMLLKNIDNYAYRMMEQFVPKMDYKFILNATPIERDLSLLVNQCRILGIPIPSRTTLYRQHGYVDDESRWIFTDLGELKDSLKYHVFNVSRIHVESAGEVTYKVDARYLKVNEAIHTLIREDNSRSLRFPFKRPELFLPEYYPSLRNLIDTCVTGKSNGDKMLVFIRNVEPKTQIKRILEELGMTVGIYDGTYTSTAEQKNYVEKEFNDGKYDVLLTNKLYGLSLKTATHAIMYDLPHNFFQYVYRAIRDLKSKELKVTVMVYDYPNDYRTIQEELNSERYQNQFSDRGFEMVKTIDNQLRAKAEAKHYD